MPKVAFYFGLGDKLHNLGVWEKFFEDAPSDRYSIYLHFQSNSTTSDSIDHTIRTLRKFRPQIVPTVETKWCATFGLTLAGLYAAIQDPDNVQVAILSDSSVPLKSFAYVYEDLAERSPQTSKFCLASPAKYRTRAENFALDGYFFYHACSYLDYYNVYDSHVWKANANMVVARAHAEIIVRRSVSAYEAYYNVWRQAAPDMRAMGEGCSDETVPLLALVEEFQSTGRSTGNYLEDLTLMGVEQNCNQLVSWRNCFAGTKLNRDWNLPFLANVIVDVLGLFWRYLFDKDFDMDDPNTYKHVGNAFPRVYKQESIEFLEGMTQEHFLFGRKFRSDSQVQTPAGFKRLEEVLPALWKTINPESARARIWSRLDSTGQPK